VSGIFAYSARFDNNEDAHGLVEVEAGVCGADDCAPGAHGGDATKFVALWAHGCSEDTGVHPDMTLLLDLTAAKELLSRLTEAIAKA
jgi:hypothetical protein